MDLRASMFDRPASSDRPGRVAAFGDDVVAQAWSDAAGCLSSRSSSDEHLHGKGHQDGDPAQQGGDDEESGAHRPAVIRRHSGRGRWRSTAKSQRNVPGDQTMSDRRRSP